MFTNRNFKQASTQALLAGAALLITGFAALGTQTPVQAQVQVQAQTRRQFPEVKDATPDGKDCYKYKGKRYCKAETGGPSNKLGAAPKGPQELKDCWWFKGKLYCIYYSI